MCKYVAGFAPIEARVRDDDFDSADEQCKEAQRGDPVSDTDEGSVPRSIRDGWEDIGRTADQSRIGHAGIISSASAHVPHAELKKGCDHSGNNHQSDVLVRRPGRWFGRLQRSCCFWQAAIGGNPVVQSQSLIFRTRRL